MAAKIDLVNAAGAAWQAAWAERAYLARLMMLPLLIKIVFNTLAYAYGAEGNLLRSAIILVPAALAEGWMLSHWARTLILAQRWPFRGTGDPQADERALRDRMTGVLGGACAYTLISLALSGYLALIWAALPLGEDGTISAEDVPPESGVFALVFLLFGIWAFRLVWLYIPVAVGAAPGDVLRRLRGWGSSFRLIGIWLLCFVPFIFALQILLPIVFAAAGGEGSAASRYAVLLLSVVVDMLKNILCTAGIAFAFKDLYATKR